MWGLAYIKERKKNSKNMKIGPNLSNIENILNAKEILQNATKQPLLLKLVL